MCGAEQEADEELGEIAPSTTQVDSRAPMWVRDSIGQTTLRNPSIHPTVCIGPPNPYSNPAAHGTKHCQR